MLDGACFMCATANTKTSDQLDLARRFLEPMSAVLRDRYDAADLQPAMRNLRHDRNWTPGPAAAVGRRPAAAAGYRFGREQD